MKQAIKLMKKIPLSRKISYRQADSKTLRVVEDSGYTVICGYCAESWGGPIYGPRALTVSRCKKHKEDASAQDLKRTEDNYWKIDPPKERFRRSNAAMERSRQKAAKRLLEKQRGGPFIGIDGTKIEF